MWTWILGLTWALSSRPAGEYLAELSRKPALLALGTRQTVLARDTAELTAQLDAHARDCSRPPRDLVVREAHADARRTDVTHFVVSRGTSLLLVNAHRVNRSLVVSAVDPPICVEEPKDDGTEVLSRDTQLVQDSARWVEEEASQLRAVHCPEEPAVAAEVVHATVKVTAGFIVGLVLKLRQAAQAPPAGLLESVKTRIPQNASGDAAVHRIDISWEYAHFQSLQRALQPVEAGVDETRFLLPSATLPANACKILGSSTFNMGTLGVDAFFQRFGYRGFDRGSEHVDTALPPSLPRALVLARGRSRLRGKLSEDCPLACPDGYSRRFADFFFLRGGPGCHTTCGCPAESNYATLCSKCCRVQAGGQCDALDPAPRCDDVPPVPSSFDLRDQHTTCFPPTVVEDQGMCGSCFAFASMGATADRICMRNPRTLVDDAGYRHLLSVQQFLSCNEAVEDPMFPGLAPEKYGCGGGFFIAAGRFLAQEGATLQDHYPYSSKCVMEGSGVVNDEQQFLGAHSATCDAVEKWIPRDLLPCACQGHAALERKCLDRDAPIKIQGIYRLPNHVDVDPNTGTFYQASDVEAMMKVDLMTEGSLYAAMRVYEDFDHFFFDAPSGVYEHRYGQQIGGHAIVIVGWGETDGIPYWLIRNSWGLNWGDSGHFRVRRGKNECGIEARVWGARLLDRLKHTPRPVNPWTLFGYHERQTFEGHNLRAVSSPKSLADLKEECKFDMECAGFDSSGVLKRLVPRTATWKSLDARIPFGDRAGTSAGGFYTKLEREKVVIETQTAESDGAGTLGPVEIFLCAPEEDCAAVPVELAGVLPGKQRFEKDAWLPLGFKLDSIEVRNRSPDAWTPAGPVIVTLPEHPGSPRVMSKTFPLAGSFGPERAPWQGTAAVFGLILALL